MALTDSDNASETVFTPDTQEEDSAEAVLGRRRALAEKREEVAAEERGEDTITADLSERKVLGLPEDYTVGDVTFPLCAVPIKQNKVRDKLIESWPQMIFFAALTDKPVDGRIFDPEAVAAIWTSATEAATPKTAGDVRAMFRATSIDVKGYLGVIAKTVLLLSPPEATLENLGNAIEEGMADVHLVDLLRAIYDASGGYPGDLRDRTKKAFP